MKQILFIALTFICSCVRKEKTIDPNKAIISEYKAFVDSVQTIGASDLGRFDSLYKAKTPNMGLAFSKEFNKNFEALNKRSAHYTFLFKSLDSSTQGGVSLSTKKEYAKIQHDFVEHIIYLTNSFDKIAYNGKQN